VILQSCFFDEKVVRLQLAEIGTKLTQMNDKQSTYIGLPKNGPFKLDQYRC
jgi:adenosylhomocysteinase